MAASIINLTNEDNTMKIDFDGIFDALGLTEEKPHYTAAEVVAHQQPDWKEVYSRKVTLAVKLIEALTCDSCHGTGTWVGTKYTRTCFRCKGKGTIDATDATRNATYDLVRISGQKEMDYTMHSNENWQHAA